MKQRATRSSNLVPTLRFLMVEDVEEDAELLARDLKSGGFVFDWQRLDTEEALLKALEQPWDVIFSDFTMPQFSGVRALKTVREHDLDVPFIFISGTIGEETAVEAMKSGAQDFMMKGKTARLISAVERELRKTELRREHRQSEDERAQLITILEATPDLVAIFELSGQLRYMNSAGRKLYGLSADENIKGRNIINLFPEPKAQQLKAEIIPAVHREGPWTGESTLTIAEGKELPVSLIVLAHTNVTGEIGYLSLLAHDISERKRFEAELQHKANHDSLTDLPNRFFLADRFTAELQRARRKGSCVGVLFLDLNNFKRVNDSLGHEAGDTLLQHVARRLQSCMRENDTVARIGGDEFTIMAGDLDTPENMLFVLHRLRTAFERPIIVSLQEIYVTFSAGIAMYPYDGDRVKDLLRHADAAMYQAKTLGSNQHCFYSPDMNARSHELLSLEAELQHALIRQEFLLHFQPQINLRNSRITGIEALIRWNSPARGVVSPNDFIPLLENSGMIISVGEWVLRQSCIALRTWNEAGLENGRIAVNVSAVQFNDKDFLDKIRRTLEEEKIPPQGLELEITENIVMRDPENAAEILEALHATGVRIAIDDFGTGYSSLAYLKRFPLHVLKIDQTFVRDLVEDTNDATIVEASISLGQKLGLEVVAEGVETASQLDFLRKKGCDSVQGYYLSRPLPASELTKLLHKKWRL